MKRTIITLLIIAALAALGFFGYQWFQQRQAAANTNFQTAEVIRGDLTASVGATGTVRSNQTALLNWQLTGKVGEVNVSLGDLVQSGDILAALDEKSLPQAVILARADLVTARRTLENLQNSDVARAQANQALVLARKELDAALEQRESKNFGRASTATIDQLRADLVLAEDAVTKAEAFYDRFDGLNEDDPNRAAAFSQLAVARRNRDRALANLNYALGKPNDQEISEADARIELAQARVKDAEREWDRLREGPDPDDIAAAQARITALEATLDQVRLEAPFAGTVTSVQVNPGDQAAPGSPIFRIDDLSRLLVDVQVTEVDINRINVGQPATMSFDAILDEEFSGKVIEVAQVGNVVQGLVNFNVTIQLDDTGGKVRPGMTAAVNIVTDLVENALIVPNRAVRLREGERVVFLLVDNQPVMTPITLGRTADTVSEVVGGEIKEGDVLVLNPPQQSFQPGGGPPPGVRGGN
jgi:HlyD family secretion protein